MNFDQILNPFLWAYVASVVAVYAALAFWRWRAASALRERRANVLRTVDEQPVERADQPLVAPGARLEGLRAAAGVDASVLAFASLVLPVLWWWLAGLVDEDRRTAVLVAFAALAIWLSVSATDVAKAFFGGLLFRLLVAFRRPFQVGDKVTLGAHAGKVTDIGLFHLRLQTLDDDQVSLPTASLWSTPLVSANAGERASLAVIRVYLAPTLGAEQLQRAEDLLWDAVGASLYWDPLQPRQIYYEQSEVAIVLTAKAYVASTYNEALFKSEVTKTFLSRALQENIALATP